MGIQELFTESKKLAVTPRYKPTKSHRILRNFAKCMGNPGISGVWKFASKQQNSSPFCPYFLIFGKNLAFWNTNRTCVLDFWYFLILVHFWGHFDQNLAKNLKICIFGSKWPQKWPKIKKYQKSKTQVLFVFQNARFLPKIRKYGQNGDEFYCLEGNFHTPQIPGFTIHFAKFREICRDFLGSYLGVTASFFNSVKSSWIPIIQIFNPCQH